MPEKETNAKKQPTGAPDLPDETKQLLADEGDVSEQKAATPEAPTEEPVAEDEQPDDEIPEETDEANDQPEEQGEQPHGLKKFFAAYWRHKKWTLLLTLVVVVAILLALPQTRYNLLGTFLTKTYTVEIVDSQNDTPVSGATVELDGHSATTDTEGQAKLQAKVGKHDLKVSKNYYQTATASAFVGIRPAVHPQQVKLAATGRRVPITVVDKLSGKPLKDADIKVIDTSAKTDDQGQAIIVLPTTKPTQAATVTAAGYNKATGTIKVTEKIVASNTLSLVPAGRVYFLSNQSGDVDVVSANFDGSNRTTVVAGNGNEDNTTQLFVSPDRKYLALYAKRDDSKAAKLYVVDTASGKISEMDTALVTFGPTGWIGDRFVYLATSLTLQDWQPGQATIKSYDATTAKVTTLGQTSAKGTKTDYIYQYVGILKVIGDRVVYGLAWSKYYGGYQATLAKQHDSIISINADGSDKQDLKDVSLSANDGYSGLFAVQPAARKLYLQVGTNAGNVYYTYQDGNITQTNAVNADDFKSYPTYFVSPNGQRTFWTENRDGQSAMFVGDVNGENGQQIATLDSSFTTYGWNTNGYLLVAKGKSELYIMPVAGPAKGKQPLKVSDYYATTHNADF